MIIDSTTHGELQNLKAAAKLLAAEIYYATLIGDDAKVRELALKLDNNTLEIAYLEDLMN